MIRTKMFRQSEIKQRRAMILVVTGTLVSGVFACRMHAQTTGPAKKAPAAGVPTRYEPNRVPRRAAAFYESVWGVDSLASRRSSQGS